MNSFLAVAVGGACGAMLRYGIALGTRQLLTVGAFPLGTFIANLVGAFLMGVLAAGLPRTAVPPAVAALLTTGFLGALTTFSTFALDAVTLWQSGHPGTAVAYAAATNMVGIGVLVWGLRWGGMA